MAIPDNTQPPAQPDGAAAAQPAPAEDTQPQTSPQAQQSGTPPDRPNNKDEQQRESNRSLVRMLVTYMAAGFLFIVGAALVAFFVATNKTGDGKDLFLAILPVAAAVVTYWFATRKGEAMKPDDLVNIIKAARDQK